MVLVVYGFPNEISALRFEWAWQNPQNSRRLRNLDLKKSSKEKQIDFRLRVLNEMLNSAPWNRLALNINWLNLNFRQEFAFPLEPPDHMKIFCRPVDEIFSNFDPESDHSDEKICFLCSKNEAQLKCTDRNCSIFYHVTCLARKFLEKRNEEEEFLIPLKGHCPSCFKSLLWTDLLRFKGQNFSQNLDQKFYLPSFSVKISDDLALTMTSILHHAVPAGIAELLNLEMLNLWNNRIEELPTSLSSLPKLRVLNLGMNRLWTLPRGFGSFPTLEVLDLTYNNLSEKSLPGNFFMLESLRALYLGDNDFEMLPQDIRHLKNLQILVLRDNDLLYLPKEVGELGRLRELHIQGNRLTLLPPEIEKRNLNLSGDKQVFRLDNNPWVPPIIEQLTIGIPQLLTYLSSETYKYLYGRHLASGGTNPPRTQDKSKKISRHQTQPGC